MKGGVVEVVVHTHHWDLCLERRVLTLQPVHLWQLVCDDTVVVFELESDGFVEQEQYPVTVLEHYTNEEFHRCENSYWQNYCHRSPTWGTVLGDTYTQRTTKISPWLDVHVTRCKNTDPPKFVGFRKNYVPSRERHMLYHCLSIIPQHLNSYAPSFLPLLKFL
jgi:hypothetical protein